MTALLLHAPFRSSIGNNRHLNIAIWYAKSGRGKWPSNPDTLKMDFWHYKAGCRLPTSDLGGCVNVIPTNTRGRCRETKGHQVSRPPFLGLTHLKASLPLLKPSVCIAEGSTRSTSTAKRPGVQQVVTPLWRSRASPLERITDKLSLTFPSSGGKTEVQRGLGPPLGHRKLESHPRLKSDLNALSSVIKFRNLLFLFYWFLTSKSL